MKIEQKIFEPALLFASIWSTLLFYAAKDKNEKHELVTMAVICSTFWTALFIVINLL